MADKFQLEIATPDRLVVREQVTEAQVPAANGYLGLLPEHSPLLAELGTGELLYTVDGRRNSLAVDGGWIEVQPDHVRVLAVHAERASEIDPRRAEEALHRAEDRLAHPDAGVDIGRALNAMKRARARLEAAKHQ